MPTLQYAIPDSLVGRTFNQIRNDSNLRAPGGGPLNFDAPSQLSIGHDDPFQKGQLLNYTTDDPTYQGGSMYLRLNSLFGNPLTSQQLAQREQDAATAARMKAIQPAVSSLEASLPEQAQKFATERTRLESEKDPLKQRYQLVLDELKRRESRDTGEVNTATAREFGRRGIPLSSGLYEETGIEKRRPISEFYGIQGREAGATYEEGSRNITNLLNQLVPQETEANRVIRNAIAQLQSGAGNAGIEDAFRQLQFMEEQRQFNEGNVLQKNQQEINKRLADAQIAQYNKPKEAEKEDPYKRFTALGEGQTLFDLLSGKSLYTAPKTYKPTGSGADTEGW